MRLISGSFLLLGVLLGFGFCVLEGYLVSQHNYIVNFKRFSIYTAPETLYFPTIRQMRALANSKRNGGYNNKAVLVIIGGSSILNGVGQPVDHLWTEHLQELLGDNYCVVNLAMRGSPPTAGAECVAEYYVKTKVPILYVGDFGPIWAVLPDGGATYSSQYWQAYAANFLLPNLKRLAYARENDLTGEGALRSNLSNFLRYDDLWSYVAYNYINTVWCSITHEKWWYPRFLYTDSDREISPPVSIRFRLGSLTNELTITRCYSQPNYKLDSQNKWQEDADAWKKTDDSYATAFVPEMRKHTLLVRVQNAPYYRDLLPPLEKERDRIAAKGAVDHMRALGFNSVAFGDNFVNENYHDRCHLTRSGGEKVAELIAPALMLMGHDLYGIDLNTAQHVEPAPANLL